MGDDIRKDNQTRRLDMPLWMLLCFAMFNAWQMGFIYFMGPSLVIDGRTPLPITTDNVTLIIAMGYILSIGYMLVLPRGVVCAGRLATAAALASVLGLFLPLPPETLALLLYIQTFCCCFLIGFETFVIVNLFSEESAVRHLTAAYAAALVLVALVQNEWMPVSFSAFRLLTLGMVGMLLVFFLRLPAGRTALPRYVRPSEGLPLPRHLFPGLLSTAFISAIMMLAGPTTVSNTPHGVSIAYLADAAAALVLYALYRRRIIHPLRAISTLMAASVAGFLLLFLSEYLPGLALPACVLVGLGFMPCQLLPLFGLTLMKNYPSRFIAPAILLIAMVTVVIHSALVELFRLSPNLLNLAYLSITVLLTMIYLQIAPYLLHSLHKTPEPKPAAPASVSPLLAQLTPREREVLDLIAGGYSNRDIARILIISEHTVNDYTKRLYRKLNVHSRHAAARLADRLMEKQ